jgi:hypothetical protein
MKVAILILALSVALVAGIRAGWLGSGCAPAREMAAVEELLSYPNIEKAPQPVKGLRCVRLPDTNLSVKLRPITREEYGPFMVRAVSWEIIENQLLATAIVEPRLSEEEATRLDPQLREFLKQQINKLSGFAVFTDTP